MPSNSEIVREVHLLYNVLRRGWVGEMHRVDRLRRTLSAFNRRLLLKQGKRAVACLRIVRRMTHRVRGEKSFIIIFSDKFKFYCWNVYEMNCNIVEQSLRVRQCACVVVVVYLFSLWPCCCCCCSKITTRTLLDKFSRISEHGSQVKRMKRNLFKTFYFLPKLARIIKKP